MRTVARLPLLLAAGLYLAAPVLAMNNTQEPLKYPVARKSDQVDNYHGTTVADPYRWLEDPDSPESRAWIEAENKVTFDYLARIPQRDGIRERIEKVWDYEKFGVPFKKGGRYFFSKNDGLQNQGVLYTADSLNDEPRVLLDPNALSKDGTVALAGIGISEDGKHMAYGLSASGSDWNEWRVRDVSTGKDTEDHLKWVKFSGASWTRDNAGFYYGRYDEPAAGQSLEQTNFFQKVYYHKLGTPQSDDALVYERKDHKDWMFGAGVSEDGRYLVLSISQASTPHNAVYYKDLHAKDAPWVELLPDFDAEYGFIGNDGPVFWFSTNKDAPRRRVIAIDTRHPEPGAWKTLVPQAAETLESANVVHNTLITEYLKDAHSQVKLYALDGTLKKELELPGLGSASGFGGERKDTETFFAFTGFTTPPAIYRLDLRTNETTLYRQPKLAFDPALYTTEQVFYHSKDGTRVPMFLTYKKGLKRDGSNPTLLYGYGGFNISMTPAFSPSFVVWMDMGGVFAEANLRGGGEYGEEWHQAGTLAKKQNVFDDFIAAAEYLIREKYTSTPKLAIYGGSNGGLLVGACLTQRPDLFGAAIPAVGVMDMLRYQKFTIGYAWASDYGTSDDAAMFKTLYAYSPLHNIKPGTHYPPTLITTADHDDRVVPAHSFKFAATLQAAQGGDAPVLIRIDTKAGHGGGKPTAKVIDEAADRFAFLVKVLGMGVK